MGGLHKALQGRQIEGIDSLAGQTTPTPQMATEAAIHNQPKPKNEAINSAQHTVVKKFKDTIAENSTTKLAQANGSNQEASAQDLLSRQTVDSLTALNPILPTHSATTQQTLHWFRQGPLRHLLDEQANIRYRTVEDPTQIFGTSATINTVGKFNTSDHQDTCSNFAFQGLVLLLATTYIVLLHNHLGDIIQIISSLFRTRIGGDRLIEEQGSSGLAQFLNVSAAIGLLFMGIITIKTGEVIQPGLWQDLMPERLAQTLGGGIVPGLILLSILILWLISLYQNLFLRIIGAITMSENFTKQLIHIKQVYFVLLTITATPTLLLLALCPPGSGTAWFYVILAQSSITFLLFLAETLNLFISKKVSTLHWFLYLCAVEIFPISLLWLMAAR